MLKNVLVMLSCLALYSCASNNMSTDSDGNFRYSKNPQVLLNQSVQKINMNGSINKARNINMLNQAIKGGADVNKPYLLCDYATYKHCRGEETLTPLQTATHSIELVKPLVIAGARLTPDECSLHFRSIADFSDPVEIELARSGACSPSVHRMNSIARTISEKDFEAFDAMISYLEPSIQKELSGYKQGVVQRRIQKEERARAKRAAEERQYEAWKKRQEYMKDNFGTEVCINATMTHPEKDFERRRFGLEYFVVPVVSNYSRKVKGIAIVENVSSNRKNILIRIKGWESDARQMRGNPIVDGMEMSAGSVYWSASEKWDLCD
ncbi:hypothetical protein [Mariprofundus sp. KV]|uniref:hypothetical protein n=1 Tax=Mariprofundus sp. KV TaxID=2608715 RepID=UPI0015A39D8E|nr:hypothetical protein [Mariprofundus sp. KV]NWF37515.1 hypothetical protein [Mariprofundus sp. KV]